jgi:hypothetical protein
MGSSFFHTERHSRIVKPYPKIRKSPGHSGKKFLWHASNCRKRLIAILHGWALGQSLSPLECITKIFSLRASIFGFSTPVASSSFLLPAWWLSFSPVRCILASVMSDYLYLRTTSLFSDVQQRKAARKKVIEQAHRLERDSYKAMMNRKRRLHASRAML